MKPYVATFVFGGLLLLALLYLYAVEFPDAHRKAEEEKRAKQLVSFQSDDVRSMTLQYRDQDAINLEKRPGGQWWLMKPGLYRADHTEVEDIIRDLALANVVRIINESGNDLGDYGLVPPQLTLSLTLKDRDEQLLIGEKGPISSQLYFKRTSEPQVYLTNLPDRDILAKTPYLLRRKELFEVDRENVDRLRLEYQTGMVSLFKTAHTWFLDAPIEFLADQSEIGALLFQIENLKAGKFIDDVEEQKRIRAQFGVPQLVIHLQANNRPHAVKFFASANDSEWIYAATTPDFPVFLVSRAAIQGIPNTLFAFRNKHLVVVDRSLVTHLALTTPDQQLVLPLEPAEQPMPHPVREFMNRVLSIQAEIPIQDNVEADDFLALGLDTPALEVKLLGSGGTVLGSLVVSEILAVEEEGQAGSANARGSALPGVYGIRSSILVSIPTEADLTVPVMMP
ncbi:MAG: hypothetical protein CMH81_06610 [Nitrospiraceae bacterium]|nr:hypothetical protein [Nitrospiraceae bacterium]